MRDLVRLVSMRGELITRRIKLSRLLRSILVTLSENIACLEDLIVFARLSDDALLAIFENGLAFDVAGLRPLLEIVHVPQRQQLAVEVAICLRRVKWLFGGAVGVFGEVELRRLLLVLARELPQAPRV